MAAIYQLTHQQLAPVVNSSNRQAASNHLELFRTCVGGFIRFLSHKRKVDEKVASTVLTELKIDPLASGRDLQTRVNGRLGRYNLSVANINVVLEAISAKEIRTAMQKQLARREAHYREAYLLKRDGPFIGERCRQKSGHHH